MYPTVTGNTIDSVAVEQLFNLANGLSNIVGTYGDEAKVLPVACACASSIIKGVGLESGEIVSMEDIVEWLKKTYNAIKNKLSDAKDKLGIKLTSLSDSVKGGLKELDLAVKQYNRVADNTPASKTITMGTRSWRLHIGTSVPSDLPGELLRMYDDAPKKESIAEITDKLLDGNITRKLLKAMDDGKVATSLKELRIVSEKAQGAVEQYILKSAKPVNVKDTRLKDVKGKTVATSYYLGNWRAVFELPDPKDKDAVGSRQWGLEANLDVADSPFSKTEFPVLASGEVKAMEKGIRTVLEWVVDSNVAVRNFNKGFDRLIDAASTLEFVAMSRGASNDYLDALRNTLKYQIDTMTMIGDLYVLFGTRTAWTAAAQTEYIKASTKALEG